MELPDGITNALKMIHMRKKNDTLMNIRRVEPIIINRTKKSSCKFMIEPSVFLFIDGEGEWRMRLLFVQPGSD